MIRWPRAHIFGGPFSTVSPPLQVCGGLHWCLLGCLFEVFSWLYPWLLVKILRKLLVEFLVKLLTPVL